MYSPDSYIYDFSKKKQTLTINQQQYIMQGITTVIKQNMLVRTGKFNILKAPTGSGKTTTLAYNLLPSIIRDFSMIKRYLILAPQSETTDSLHKLIREELDGYIIDGREVIVYDDDDYRSFLADKAKRPRHAKLLGDVQIFVFTTQYAYNLYMNSTLPKVDILFIDEAGYGVSCPGAAETFLDKGYMDNNFNPSWLPMITYLITTQNVIAFGLSATPTNSQSDPLSTTFSRLADMPKEKIANCITEIHINDDIYTNIEEGVINYLSLIERTVTLQQAITTDTWDKLEGRIYKMMPALMITSGKSDSNPCNSIRYLEMQSLVDRILCKHFNSRHPSIVIMSNSSENGSFFDGIKTASLSDNVELANSPQYINYPLIVELLMSGNMGMNIPRIHTVIVGSRPSQDTVPHRVIQIAGRSSRMPFFHSNVLAAEFIRDLDIDDDQKELVLEYYIQLTTSNVILPNNSALMIDVKKVYGADTWDTLEGTAELNDIVFDNTFKYRSARHKNSFDIGNAHHVYRKNMCEVCRTEENGKSRCYNLVFDLHIERYDPNITHEEFEKTIWSKIITGDHVMRESRLHNDPTNLVFVCPLLHAWKTIVFEDFRNDYTNLTIV